MPLRLLKYGLSKTHPAERHFARTPELKPNYDVVIIGGGGHGLACAYYLAKYHGITNVAVLEKSYVGGGNTGRNTAIVRSNYLTPEGVRFYDESMRLYQNLSAELDFNIMYSERGHFTLAHTDSAIRTARWRAEVNKHLGVDSEVVYRDDLRRMIPLLNLSEDVRYPVMGALYHPPGAIARHDAVAWGYGGRASQLGVEIHQGTEVIGIKQEGGRVTGVITNRGEIGCGRAMQAVAGMSSVMAAKAGFKLPISSTTLQACVSTPLKPFLNDIVVSGSLHVYSRYNTRTTLDLTEGLMAHMLELFPFLGEVPLLRHWAGIVDMTPDFSPIMGETPIENYYIDSGWGTWGFKATPVCGKRMAETLATGRVPDILKPFRLSRFNEFALVGEKGAASVGH